MIRTTQWIAILSAALMAFLLIANTVAAEPPDEEPQQTASPRTAEEIIPGVPLDGSIIIDESVWRHSQGRSRYR